VKESAEKYDASILIDTLEKVPEIQEPENILGIDLGVMDIVVTSAGAVVPAPKFFILKVATGHAVHIEDDGRDHWPSPQASVRRMVVALPPNARRQLLPKAGAEGML
jgi:hypothetical protein